MDRRKALSCMGAAAAGAVVGHSPSLAQDHGAKAPGAIVRPDFHLYVCAFHVAKDDPGFSVEAHHYCAPVRDGVHQCVIYDKHGPGARLLGVEYIISDEIYRGLPDEEKAYYHPHTYEVISGLLRAPEMSEEQEEGLMGVLLTTWGKTWHTWPDPATDLPMGDPLLMWSYGQDGQAPEGMVASRDKSLKEKTAQVRERRRRFGPIPNVSPPKSRKDLGRQWTDEGPDVPPKD